MTLAIDFETDWSGTYSVAVLGAWAYCRDPRFNAHTVSLCGSDGWEWVGHPSAADWGKALSYGVWVSHNAGFDSEVYRAAVKGAEPERWHCTGDLMGYLQHPRSLKDGVRVAFGVELDKSMRDRLKEESLFKPTAKEVNDYALEDARWCLKLWQQFSPRWPEWERQLSEHTRTMARRGIGFDVEAAHKAVELLTKKIESEELQIPWVSTGLPPTSRNALFAECEKLGLPRPASTAEKNPAWQAWLDLHESHVPWVRGLNRWRKLNRTREVIHSMLLRCDGRRLHASLRYYGAAITGRWAGGDGLNMQNLNSRDTEGGVDLRALVRPEPGNVFVVSDLAQIEPRVLAVLCGDDAMLDYLRTGADLYESHARATMGYTDPRPLEEVDANLRKLAKARVLGLGYGCGAEKFVTVAKTMADLDLEPETAAQNVQEFREQNPRIVGYWSRMQRAFSQAKGKVWAVKTPAGRPLRYFEPEQREAAATKGERKAKVYGGKLVENFVQATARDVLASMVLAIEAAGVPVVLTVHDEVVCEVKEQDAADALDTAQKIMTTPPEWMPTLPLKCKAQLMTAYGK